MADITIDRILQELAAPGAEILALLQRYHTAELSPLWQHDPRLYRAFGQRLIGLGQPTMAFELVREGLLHQPADADLLYLRALALARGRNLTKAEEYVQELLNTQ